MSLYYIVRESPYEVYSLDSTVDISITLNGKLTDFPIEDGSSVQDHYVNKNRVVSFKGTITTHKSSSGSINRTPTQYIEGLEAIKEGRETFSVIWHPDRPALENCVFTSLRFNQNKKSGFINQNSNSLGVSFTAKQVRFAQRAGLSVETSQELKEKTETKQSGDGYGTDDGDKKTSTEAQLSEVGKLVSRLMGGE